MEANYTIRTEPHPAERTVTLLLDGKFGEDALAELNQSISAARDSHQLIYVDLSEVTLVDRKVVEFFSEHAVHNVKLINCPIYLRRWIAQVSDEAER